MKNNKGFLLLPELICFSITVLLLTLAVSSFWRAAGILQRTQLLAEMAAAAQQVLAGEAYSGRLVLTQQQSRQQGLMLVEVNAGYGKMHYKLVCAQQASEGLSSAGAAVLSDAGSGAGADTF